MVAVSYSTIRNNLKNYCDKATENNETIIVTRKDEKNVVILSIEAYNELVRYAENAKYLAMLDKSFKQLEEGNIVLKNIDDIVGDTNE